MPIPHLEEHPVLQDKLTDQILELVMLVAIQLRLTELEVEEEVLQWEELQQLPLEQVEQEELAQLTVLQLLDTLQLLMQAEEAEAVD